MHQIASNLLSLFLSPLNWIIILIIAQYFYRSPRAKKICRLSALAVFLLFTNIWLVTLYANWWQPKPRDVSKDSTYSCAILLGGFASPDPNNNGYFNATADRFIQAVKLYKQQKIQHILISGGNGKLSNKDFSEAAWVHGELNSFGVPDSAILFEDRSNNTADNAANTKKLLDSAQLKPPYLLITSAHHIPRATLIFKNAGINTVAYPCCYVAGNDGYHLNGIIPSPEVLFRWGNYLKETAGYLIYKVKGK
jgi:uncharacterized SAM-binding protein YcdF (DUF218 family)